MGIQAIIGIGSIPPPVGGFLAGAGTGDADEADVAVSQCSRIHKIYNY